MRSVEIRRNGPIGLVSRETPHIRHRSALMTRILIAAATVIALSAQNPTPAPAQVPDTSCPDMAAALQALVRNDARFRDWANLTRYHDANRTLPAPAAGEARVVFMGDSITDAW